MNKIFTFLAAVFVTASTLAQTPDKMSYQAVVRDSGDNLVSSQPVGMQISILQSSASGIAVYVETHTPTTNINGLVTLEIGTGSVVSGDFTTIDWSADSYFIKTETDPAGGTNYTITGTSQLLSVPYAMHAKTADNAQNAFSGDYNDLANNPWDSSGSNIYNTNTNNVGIGTSTPQNALDVRTTNDTGVAIFKNDLPSWAYISIGNQTTGASGSEGLMLGYTPANVALIRNLYNSPMTFWTNNQERLRLSADGDVGIGTSTPSTLINAVKNQNAQTAMSLENLTAGTSASVEYILRNDSEEYAKLGLRSSASNTYGALSPNNGYIYTGATAFTIMTDDVAGVIKFATGGNIEKMRLSAAGELGIGTTNPTSKLDVAGNVNATSFTGDGSGLTNLPATGTDDQTASEVTSTAIGDIEATDVDAAIAELEAEKAALSGATFTGNVTFSGLTNVNLNVNNINLTSQGSTVFDGPATVLYVNPAVEFSSATATTFNGGSLRIIDGNQAAGKVLTSDAAGNASWVTPSGSSTYSVGFNSDLGGYVFYVTPDGKHGLVAATQDQSISADYFNAFDVISVPTNYSATGQNFTDWRVPTKHELSLMYANRVNIGGFTTNRYWTSISQSGFAWYVDFSTGTVGSFQNSSLYYVRAVRNF